ncbi:hypothetical protein [Liquorilactobacillus sicerae]|nr:hypothetical protein [Liquorilactobacillus sicerae]
MTAFLAIIGILALASGIQFFTGQQKKQDTFKHFKRNHQLF